MEHESLKEIIEDLKGFTSDGLQPGALPSFHVAQVLAGDVMVLPAGFVFLERAVNADSITVKVAGFAKE